jgi:transposase InsO family protein
MKVDDKFILGDNNYCSSHGIKRKFSIARTPQQNGVVERKNTTI